MTRRIPIFDTIEPAGLNMAKSAWYCGYGRTKFWYYRNLPKNNPLRINATATGVCWVKELDRHLKVATELGRKAA